jgi:predicted acyltransferase
MSHAPGEGAGRRLMSLDILRGLAVAAMILVNSPGSWSHVYAPLQHAEWNGWTAADLIFPAFLFSVGASMRFSLGRRAAGSRWQSALGVGRRGMVLILIGLALNALISLDWATLRIPGVLQRIGLCFMLSGWLFLATAVEDQRGALRANRVALIVITVAILIGYWLLLSFGRLDVQSNLPAWLDRTIFTPAHLWRGGPYDPEGLLSSLPACANVFIGVIAADFIKDKSPENMVRPVIAAGAALMAAGLLIDPLFPINKSLWTSSFVLLSSGFSLFVLGLLLATADRGRGSPLFLPALMFGRNAALAYIGSMLLGIASGWRLSDPAGTTLQALGFDTAQLIFREPQMASAACALAILLLMTGLTAFLYRRRVHLSM